ncbi:MAG: cbb3-type cytochrome c oxidase subunit 3 [Candidatus Competibacteraceae bacterium]|nr:MAG: cbb3-type cytochrome c oxidase subunit 3 [Candidatus Competibacteraceae bacterium]
MIRTRRTLVQAIAQFLSDYGWFIGIPVIFIVVVLYVFRPSARKKYEEHGKIPLQDQHVKHD